MEISVALDHDDGIAWQIMAEPQETFTLSVTTVALVGEMNQ